MIRITPSLSIHEYDLEWEFVRSSGPGGQNVNKVATAVQLRFNVKGSASLPDAVRERLILIAGKRITTDGTLIINASRFRTQERNRKDALDRLIELIRKASEKPRKRHKTHPSAISREKRLDSKKRRGEIKRLRKFLSYRDD